MAIAIVILILILVTVIFHFLSPWWFTPIASNWTSIDTTINVTLWVTGFVFIIVNLFLAYAVYRFRYNKNRRADYEPENKKLEGWLTLVTTVGVAAMLAPGLVVWADFVAVPEDADEFEVVGQQWSWSFRFPGKDKVLGKVDTRLISAENPFGLSLSDPFGKDDILVNSNQLHLPINQPVKVLQRSKDVLHNFAVPQFRVKMDLVPGLTSYFWFTPTKLGDYEIFCQELCGFAHYLMRGKITVGSLAEHQQWLTQYPTFAQTQNQPKGDLIAGKKHFQNCVACHGDQGAGNSALNSPRIAGLSQWYIKRQLSYFKDKIRGNKTDDTFGLQMASMMATLPDETAINDVAAYIESLTTIVAKEDLTTLTNATDLSKGKALYSNCRYCHGENGQGNYILNAPNIAGQYDWYLKRQIANFQNRLRGTHQGDLYGNQMVLMARLLHSEQDIDDVSAYISNLPTTVTKTSNQQQLK